MYKGELKMRKNSFWHPSFPPRLVRAVRSNSILAFNGQKSIVESNPSQDEECTDWVPGMTQEGSKMFEAVSKVVLNAPKAL
jgi:hypothetical protein